VSGRSVPLPGIESMVGLLINTLPLRVRLADGDRLVPWLEQVQARQLEIQEFAYTPLVRIQGWSAVPRGQALFQSIQAFENYPRGDQASDDAGGRIEGLEFRERANYPLGLIVVPGGPLVVELDYDRGLFGDAEAKRLLGHLEQLLVGMTAATDKPLAALSLLSPAERRQVLHDWNRTRSPYSHDRCLHELVEEQAARGPSRVAVTFAGRHLTCRELHLRSNRLAHYLKRRGVGPEVVAGICLPRSLDLVVAVLGVLKAGGAFLPLDPTYPRERLAFMVADAAVPVLVTVAQLAELLPEHAAERVLVDVEAAAIAEQSAATPAGGAGPDNLAYVIYTSGSTGRPKGVMVPHRGLCNAAQLRIFGLRPEDRLLQFWAFSFDAAVAEIAMALRVGATLVLARPEAMLPGPELIGLLREQGITVLHLPPAALATLPDEPLPAARLVITGGEVVSAELVARWAPGRSFRNIYGPTESTIWTSSYRCVDGTRTLPSGRPIANLRTYVLDCRRQPLPVGAPGELHAGGVGVTRGYLRRPALTAERFGPDPWSGESGARLYRTGDRVRLLADGNLEFLGRVDEQMKIRGFRIEPGEIEAVLAAHPDVRQAAVVVRTVAGDRRLTAYVVAGEPAPERDALRAFVAERLPEHMVPAAFVRIEALPLSPAGKVDRRALATMETAELERSTAFHAPTSELEQAVAAVWQEVLGIEKVGLDDNFFDLGGHSLLLVRLHGELRQRFEADLSQIDLFDKPTVRALAEHLGGATVPVPALTTPAVGAVENAVAVIGMAGRFPGARNLDELWRNLRDGVESIRTFSDEEALAAGVSRERLARPDLVKAAGVLDEPDYFDAAFFGIPPREADLLDPQQRIFLELAWEALENAGYAAGGVRIGVYAGVENSTYLTSHLATHPDLAKQVSYFQVMLLNNRDFLPTRVSYKLGLRGPSVNVQTACSTSLVAIHHACRSLLDGECDLVLAGGVSIRFPQQAGYLHQEGGILSPDGHCRPFDAGAAGTVSGNGAGIVVL
ncbi:MAG: amino acid adenylation domain-containing protein, partial [bacterium]|nr:amino acid adenylation domain-containing protein [bacterium]